MDDSQMRQALSTGYQSISSYIEEAQGFAKHFGLEQEQARKKWESWQRIREEAVQGREKSRNHLVLLYASLLLRMDNPLLTHFFISPHPTWLLLELLLEQEGLEEMLKTLKEPRIDRHSLLDALQRKQDEYQRNVSDERQKARIMARMMFAQENGQDVLDSLQYQKVDELGALRRDYVYLVHRGRKIHLEGLSFPSRNALFRIQQKAASHARPQYDFNRPALSVEKDSGSRITVAGYLATPSAEDLYFNERLFNLKKVTLESLRDDYATIDEKIYRLLCLNQKGRGSFLVTGSEMGIGKTTFLSALIEKIPDSWGIGILDTENELKVQEHYPRKNIISVIENPHLGTQEGFRYMLKTARDVLVVGEITCTEEMQSLVRGAIRLNAGIGGTLHSAKASMALRCCANLLGESIGRGRAEEDLTDCLDLIIHLARHPGEPGRIVVEDILEVRRKECDWEAMSLYELKRKEILNRLDPRPYTLAVLAHFDYENNRFVHPEEPSFQYLQKIGFHAGSEVGMALKENWRD